jgi:hypothetical protein
VKQTAHERQKTLTHNTTLAKINVNLLLAHVIGIFIKLYGIFDSNNMRSVLCSCAFDFSQSQKAAISQSLVGSYHTVVYA